MKTKIKKFILLNYFEIGFYLNFNLNDDDILFKPS